MKHFILIGLLFFTFCASSQTVRVPLHELESSTQGNQIGVGSDGDQYYYSLAFRSGDTIVLWNPLTHRFELTAKSTFLSGYPSGSGTSGTLTKWTGTNTIGDAAITEDATRLSASLPFRLANIATVSLPGVPSSGDVVYNTTTGNYWGYYASSWRPLSLWEISGSNIYFTAGKVSVGTSSAPNTGYSLRTEGGVQIVNTSSTNIASLFTTNNQTLTSGFNSRTGNNFSATITGASGASGLLYGLLNNMTYSGSANFSGNLIGSQYQVYNSSSATVTNVIGFISRSGANTSSANTITNLYGVWVGMDINNTGSGTTVTNLYDVNVNSTGSTVGGKITNRYGVRVGNYPAFTNGGYITNNYGLYIQDQTRGATINYAIYSEGGQSYHAGSFGIGIDAPSAKVDIVGDLEVSSRTGTATALAGWAADNKSADITVGSGLSLSGGTLSATSSADGNGIYSGSDDLTDAVVTFARMPVIGDISFGVDFDGFTLGHFDPALESNLNFLNYDNTEYGYYILPKYQGVGLINGDGSTSLTELNLAEASTALTANAVNDFGSAFLGSNRAELYTDDETTSSSGRRAGFFASSANTSSQGEGSAIWYQYDQTGSANKYLVAGFEEGNNVTANPKLPTGVSSRGFYVQDYEQGTGTKDLFSVLENGEAYIQDFAHVGGAFFTQTAIDTVTNTASETSLINTGVGSVTLPADYLEEGRTIVCEGAGWWSNNSVTPSLQFRQKIGAVTVGATAATSMPDLAAGQEFWEYKVIMTCQTAGASGTVMTQGSWTWQYGDFTDGRKLTFSNTTTSTIDTTSPNALDFTVQMGGADASAFVVMTNFVCEAKN